MGPDDQVILVQHCPDWLVDWFWGHTKAKNLRQLVRGPLAGRARVQLAGEMGPVWGPWAAWGLWGIGGQLAAGVTGAYALLGPPHTFAFAPSAPGLPPRPPPRPIHPPLQVTSTS